ETKQKPENPLPDNIKKSPTKKNKSKKTFRNKAKLERFEFYKSLPQWDQVEETPSNQNSEYSSMADIFSSFQNNDLDMPGSTFRESNQGLFSSFDQQRINNSNKSNFPNNNSNRLKSSKRSQNKKTKSNSSNSSNSSILDEKPPKRAKLDEKTRTQSNQNKRTSLKNYSSNHKKNLDPDISLSSQNLPLERTNNINNQTNENNP
ncbi:hypothetical protein BB560_003845, partial [Smittium megazygosporum]